MPWPRSAALALALSVAACTPAPPPPPREVATRIVDALDAADAPAAAAHCTVDGETRPALGCTAWTPVADVTVPADGTAGIGTRDVPVPAVFVPARPTLRRLVVRPPGGFDEERMPSVLLAPDVRTTSFDPIATVGAGVHPDTRILLEVRSLAPDVVRTTPLRIAPGSVLAVGTALDPTTSFNGVRAVAWEIRAESPRGEQVLFAETTPVGTTTPPPWRDRRVPLDAVAGDDVRLAFRTRLVPRDDAGDEPLAAQPLWGTPEVLAPAPAPGRNVVLVSFDTLRADHLGVYGATLPTSPTLDAFARDALVFDDVQTSFPSTTASHMTMLTGRLPIAHAVRSPQERLASGIDTLAGLLAARGWQTAAVTEDAMLNRASGFDRGVGHYRESTVVEKPGVVSRQAEQTFDAALAWLDGHADERFFLFVHTYAVHWPYEPPPEHDLFTTWRDGDVERPVAEAPEIVRFERRYAGEVHYADAQMARLLRTLDRLGIAGRTVVAVTGDHGEEFGEHGGWSHSRTLYGEVLHVPLLVRVPGTPGRRVAGPASMADVTPTLLEAAGAPAPPGLDGTSLLAAPPDPARPLFAENVRDGEPGSWRVAVRLGDEKWIWSPDQQRVVEAYDLRRDPAEQHPLTDPAMLDRGAALAQAYVARGAAPVVRTGSAVDPATRRKLQALGYVP